MLSVFDLIAILLVLTAVFGWVNHRLIRLPHTIGLLMMGLVASLVLVGVELMFPDETVYEQLIDLLRRIDFQSTVLEGMLGFLLFAGALHVDLAVLRSRAWAVGSMATLGVLISTAIVGVGFWLAAGALGVALPFTWALVFGALISPTDPVAVLSTLKAVRVPETLETDMIGESLFNDGVGVVIFTVVLAVAAGAAGEGIDPLHVAELFFVEALGGAVLGVAAGYVAYKGMEAIDDYPIEVLLSLALVTGTYALATHLHLSGPIAMVVAGLLIGNHGQRHAMSDRTQRYLLVARLAAVSVPVGLLSRTQRFIPGTIPCLTWGGLRGGISVALALSIPEVAEKSTILAATYTVVIFTIVVQGLSLRALVARVVRPAG